MVDHRPGRSGGATGIQARRALSSQSAPQSPLRAVGKPDRVPHRRPYLTRRRIAEISERVERKLHRRFPIGCRVRLSREGRRALGPKYAKATGRVVGYFARVSPKVLWQGRKTADSYAWEFLTRVRPRRRRLT